MPFEIKKILNESDIISIHDFALEESPGLPGFCHTRPLSSALQRINNHITYEGFSDIFEVAALYAVAIACGHTFNDGNKRTALVSMVTFLNLNGLSLQAENKEIEDIMVNVAEKKVDMKKLAVWIKQRCQDQN